MIDEGQESQNEVTLGALVTKRDSVEKLLKIT
jgi:hypothetical protein